MAVVYLGIGSNLGDRRSNCETALRLLEESGVRITRRSAMIDTEPWGETRQPRFINMAAEVYTDLPPHELLHLLKNIEVRMGRKQSKRWGARVIDMDILLFDDIVLSSEELIIPHPLMQERPFVLKPLAEINPDLRHPILGKTIGELSQEINSLQ